MSEVLFDRLAKWAVGGVSRREVLKYLGGFLAGGFLMGVTGKVRADDDHGKGGRGKGDDGGDGGDDDDQGNEEINETCHKFCRMCPRRPRGVFGQCMSHCKRFLHKNPKGALCGACTAANPFTGCVVGATCCAATKTAAAYCSNLNTDVNNCGTCGTVCSKGTTPGCCAAACTDLATDVNNCGTCGTVCSGTTPNCCAGACTNLASDVNNCGACGTKCTSTQKCTKGVCG